MNYLANRRRRFADRYYHEVLADSPVFYARLGEAVGTTGAGSVIDSSGNGNHGTPNNGVIFGQSGFLYGKTTALFDEVNDYVSVPDFNYSGSATFELWVKPTDNVGTQFQYVLSHGAFAATNSINIYLSEASASAFPNEVAVKIRDTGVEDAAVSTPFSTVDLLDGGWHQIVIVAETGQALRVYLDGVSRNTGEVWGGFAAGGPSGSLYLGAREDLNVDRFYGGNLAEVSVYNTALSAARVLTHYNAAL